MNNSLYFAINRVPVDSDDVKKTRSIRLKLITLSNPKNINARMKTYRDVTNTGYGNSKQRGGLSNDEIDKMMSRYKEFKGCFHMNDLDKIKPSKSKFGFCILVPFDKSNDGHWVAVYVSPKEHIIEYYDPFGEPPGNTVNKYLKKIVQKMNSDYLFQYKINRIKNQRVNSDTCGWHSCDFLIKRIVHDVHFKDATGYSNVLKSERHIDKLKQKVKKFGYL